MTTYARVRFSGLTEQERPVERVFAMLGPDSSFRISNFIEEPYSQLEIANENGHITVREQPMSMDETAETRELVRLQPGDDEWGTSLKTAWSSVGQISIRAYEIASEQLRRPQ
jgi:hypothetical protein